MKESEVEKQTNATKKHKKNLKVLKKANVGLSLTQR